MWKRNKLDIQLKALIAKAGALGLPKKDQDIAYEFLEYNEPALALDQVAVQLYEFDIKIDQECYDDIMRISALFANSEYTYPYLKELITVGKS